MASFTVRLSSVFLLTLALASQAAAQAPDGAAILQPLAGRMTAKTGILIRVDLDAIDPKDVDQLLNNLLPDAKPPELAEGLKKALEVRADLLAAGCRQLILLEDPLVFQQGPPWFAAPPTPGANTAEIVQVLEKHLPEVQTKIAGGVVYFTGPDAPDFAAEAPALRPEFAEGLQSVRGAAVQVVFAPSAELRGLGAQLGQQIPLPLGDFSLKELSEGFRFIAFGLRIGDKAAARLVVEASTPALAEKLHKAASGGLQAAKALPAVQEQGEKADEIVRLLTPQLEGQRLSITLTKQNGGVQQALAQLSEAMQRARGAASRATSSNNLKQIALAMHIYHDTFGKFPARASRTPEKKSLLSWRVQILPFVEEKSLYDQFKHDEPWDSPHNKALIAKMPRVYASPLAPPELAAEGKTTYVVPVAPKAIFAGEEGLSIIKIPDGTSNTLLVLEAVPEKAVIWTKPDDLEIDDKAPLTGLAGSPRAAFLAALADGSVRTLADTIDLTVFRALLTKDGGEAVQAP